ncbi:hypothetical protein JVU11DRAFT_11934 [Chiua virens]|nr:hypothetical protein JVU11DRAFT_11934 [Chiua virens]
MAAPALGALIVSFFYNGHSSLAVTFPNVFTAKFPEVAICLVAMVLQASINKYVATSTHEDHKFKYQGYSKIYAQFHSMQFAINNNLKHTTKTKALRVKWAESANVPANEPGNIIMFEDDFVPILD